MSQLKDEKDEDDFLWKQNDDHPKVTAITFEEEGLESKGIEVSWNEQKQAISQAFKNQAEIIDQLLVRR